jgi:hypothetical protein
VSQHEVVSQIEDVPRGYETYSALLIPEYEWFNASGIAAAYNFLEHFKRIGKLLGPQHLTFWFYHSYFSHGSMVDKEVVATISGHISSQAELEAFEKEHFARGGVGEPKGSYDVGRARLICAALSLEYSNGPYLLFFTKHPHFPYYCRGEYAGSPSEVHNSDALAIPDRVLQFGGLSLSRSCELLDKLESALLSNPYATSGLIWKQRWLQIEEWCSANRDTLLKVLSTVITKRSPESEAKK